MDECYTSNVPFGALVCGWKIKLYFGRNIQYQYVISLVWPTRNSLKLYFTPPKPYILFCPHLSSPLIRSSLHPPPPLNFLIQPLLPFTSFKKKGRKDILICKGITKKGCLSTTSAHSNFLFFFISPVQQVLRGAIVAYLQINIRTDRQSWL